MNKLLTDNGNQAATNKTIDAEQNAITNIGTNELAAKYKDAIEILGIDFDWELAQTFRHTLLTDEPIQFENVHVGVKNFIIQGDHTLDLPSWVNVMNGEYKGNEINLVQIVCTNSTIGFLQGWCNIYQEVI